MKIAIVVVCFILFLLFFLKLNIKIYLNMENKHVTYQLSIIIWKWQKDISLSSKKEDKTKSKKGIPDFIKRIEYKKNLLYIIIEWKKIITRLIATFELNDVNWITTLGVMDAAVTGRFIGHIWAIKMYLFGMLSHYISLKEIPYIQVYPVFNGLVWKMEFKCIISFRLGHVIIAGIQILWLFIKLIWMSKSALFKTSLEYQTIEK